MAEGSDDLALYVGRGSDPIVLPRWEALKRRPLYFLKRWWFSRCTHCGAGFRFGEVPLRLGRPGPDASPGWFRSEPGVYHAPCLLQPRVATWRAVSARIVS